MAGFLFHEVVFGPVRSRRLGLSLGINLLPIHSKYCSFNCIYCDCGWTPRLSGDPPSLAARCEKTDLTLIVDDTIALRNELAPEAKVTVLSNASMLHQEEVFKALLKLDNNIQKLDGGTNRIFHLMHHPLTDLTLDRVVANLKRFRGEVIIQTMFLRGHFRGQPVDNTTEEEVVAWIEKLREIQPKSVMIYPVARATPVHDLEKIPIFELEQIAEKVKGAGIRVEVYQ